MLRVILPVSLVLSPILVPVDPKAISSIIKEMGLDKDIYKYKQIQQRISAFKNSLITVKAYYNNPELETLNSRQKSWPSELVTKFRHDSAEAIREKTKDNPG